MSGYISLIEEVDIDVRIEDVFEQIDDNDLKKEMKRRNLEYLEEKLSEGILIEGVHIKSLEDEYKVKVITSFLEKNFRKMKIEEVEMLFGDL
jgi:hypothetical protein